MCLFHIRSHDYGRPLSNWCSSIKLSEECMEDDYDSHKSCLLGKSRWKRHGVTEETMKIQPLAWRTQQRCSLTRSISYQNQKQTGLWTFLFLLLFYSNYLMNYSPVKHCEWWNRPQILVPGLHHIERKTHTHTHTHIYTHLNYYIYIFKNHVFSYVMFYCVLLC